MPPTETPILLLKTRSSPHDGYDDFFTGNGYRPSFIPVLEHRFNAHNLADVRDLFASGAFNHDQGQDQNNGKACSKVRDTKRKYGGMIFTSQRAVEGFANMIEEKGLPYASSTPLILYTVGPATARTLTTLRDKHLPSATIYGADAGNGENLAHMILQHYNSIYSGFEEEYSKPALLFLVGDQRRDIIPRTLMGSALPSKDRIIVEEMVVYETGEMESFEGDFRDSISGYADANEIWVVVFSPSGCEGMLRVLKLGPFVQGEEAGQKRKAFIATIGPTTRDHLRNKFSFEPDVCAEKPSPEGVAEGIRRFRESRAKA
ncbi:Tetrapyrrole biosynthesis uroporphyrinogen III synthase [Penicillium angulare]|uniref:Tetrapyrrole biosynthesis uroporphyrinogen III synthase n=1 Tax=Penicillium angulare TaxID=116970 RepID=UPI002540F82B|nr:Tetrapyrrole biosynthesis uroporphyrinogen III synthase [Penicillium angulare]KAJ5259485.1 Tetrapyrrole biosynthesis uroporphyrinogen III synthase [Penicillium angulare]